MGIELKVKPRKRLPKKPSEIDEMREKLDELGKRLEAVEAKTTISFSFPY